MWELSVPYIHRGTWASGQTQGLRMAPLCHNDQLIRSQGWWPLTNQRLVLWLESWVWRNLHRTSPHGRAAQIEARCEPRYSGWADSRWEPALNVCCLSWYKWLTRSGCSFFSSSSSLQFPVSDLILPAWWVSDPGTQEWSLMSQRKCSTGGKLENNLALDDH